MTGHRQTISDLRVTVLSEKERRERFMAVPYKYLVTIGSTPFTAYESPEAFARFLDERGLRIGEAEAWGRGFKIDGSYVENMTFDELPEGPNTRQLCNGNYTRVTITEEGGLKVMNFHNPNVPNRALYDYRESCDEWQHSFTGSPTIDRLKEINAKIEAQEYKKRTSMKPAF